MDFEVWLMFRVWVDQDEYRKGATYRLRWSRSGSACRPTSSTNVFLHLRSAVSPHPMRPLASTQSRRSTDGGSAGTRGCSRSWPPYRRLSMRIRSLRHGWGASVADINIPYYVVIGGRGYWRPFKKLRVIGFKDITCGVDGRDAWQIAMRWNRRVEAALSGKDLPEGMFVKCCKDASVNIPTACRRRRRFVHCDPLRPGREHGGLRRCRPRRRYPLAGGRPSPPR